MAMSQLDADQVVKTVFDDTNDALQVSIVAGGGTIVLDSEIVDDSAFTPGTTSVIMVGATYDDTSPDSVNEGDGGAIRMSANRALHGTIRDAAGNERGANVTAGNALVVDGSAVTQPVSAASLPLPSGAATSAKQDTLSAQIPTTLGQKAMASSLAVVVASDQSTIPVSAASLPLPSGAATEATLSTLNGKVTACNTGAVVVSSSALPSGAATEATLSAASAKLPATLGQKAMAASLAVVVASDQSAIPVSQSGTWTIVSAGMTVVDFIDTTPVLDTSSTNIAASSANPTQVVATLASNVKKLKFDWASGEFVGVYTGAALSEVLVAVIGPGSDSTVDVTISSGARISLRNMANATISSGKLCIQFIG